MNDMALELVGVSKTFGEFKAVDSVSLGIPTGSIYGFLGPNGAGKTTTIRMILGIFKPSGGTISVLGHASALDVRDRIGYLPEEKGLYKKMKAWAVIAFFAGLKGMARHQAKKRAHELLERYGLGEFSDRKIEALSKGMSQKVQMLASIAHDPELVILDEPFSGLDPVNQQVMEEIIRDMAQRQKTVLFSTHVMQHAERLCDRLLLISRGKKIFDGTLVEAKSTLPRRVFIETGDPTGALVNVAGVLSVQPATDPHAIPGKDGAVCRWEIRLGEHADPQSVLQACFEKGIRLHSLNLADPTLHDVFVHLVGPDAKEGA
jgi:ABC-2 type transport system ATP-binding protein